MRKFFFALSLFLIIALGIAFLGQCVSNKMVLWKAAAQFLFRSKKRVSFSSQTVRTVKRSNGRFASRRRLIHPRFI